MDTMLSEYQCLHPRRGLLSLLREGLAIPADAMAVLLEILRFLAGAALLLATAVILLMLE